MPDHPKTAVRQEVQALRALAVALVVAYHLWPEKLTGGFIGVDVFFVISGFLITSHLVREVERSGTVSVTRFWARRIRRLLPAAFVVLLVSFVLTVLFLPKATWPQTFVEIAASALYVENWVLAANSVDYLAAANQASIVQHFWSLSVEEQFYIVWPWLIVLALLIARRFAKRSSSTRTIVVALSIVAIASFVFSVVETARSQPAAYFVTPTRAWEFAAGGLLALAPVVALPIAARVVASWVGLAAIAASAVLLSGSSPFPGSIALVPVLGAVLIIAAGDVRSRWAPTYYTAIRPVQFVGDISYSIYLWHWPLIVLYPLFLLQSPNLVGGLGIIAVTLVLAWLSKRFVEDPFRTGDFWAHSRRRAFALAAGGIAITLVATGIGTVAIRGMTAQASAAQPDFTSQADVAAAISATLRLDDWPMTDQVASNDAQVPEWVVDGCTSVFEADVARCSYGPADADRVVAVVGDSYATTYLPAIRAALVPEGWRVQVLTLAQCPISEVAVHEFGSSKRFSVCDDHRDFVDEQLDAIHPDLILGASSAKSTMTRLMSGATGDAARDEWAAGLDSGLRRLVAHGVPVMVLGGPPAANCAPLPFRPPTSCAGVAELKEQPLLDAESSAATSAGVQFIDTRWWFCDRSSKACPEQVGSTLVRADRDHLTGHYSARLGPVLMEALLAHSGHFEISGAS